MLELQLDLDAGGGRRSALETTLRSAIRSGRLAPGAALPSSRSLASDLGVSRSTVVAAYDQLVAEGYLVARHGSATRVATLRSATEPERDDDLFGPTPLHDFRPGEPSGSSFPRARWLRSLRRVIDAAPDTALGYADPRGVDELRSALADYVSRTRTVVATQPAVHVVGGYGAGLGFLAEALRRRGVERIAVEDPMLPMHVTTLRAAGLETVPVPMDSGGIDIGVLRSTRVGAVVVTPAHQYPTAITMSASRRSEMIDWARDADTWIIEDDYDGEFRYDRRPIGALQGLGPDRVVYGGTISKSLSPALRIGWLVVPDSLRADLLRVVNVRAGVSTIDQLTLADFLVRGELDRQVRSMRTVYRKRNDAIRTVLAETAPWLELGDGAAGLHLIARLHETQLDEATVLAAADDASVGMLGLTTHHRSTAAGTGFAIGFSRPPDHHFPTALERLGEVLASLG